MTVHKMFSAASLERPKLCLGRSELLGDNNERSASFVFPARLFWEALLINAISSGGKSHNASGVLGLSRSPGGWRMVSADVGAHVKTLHDSTLMLFTEGLPPRLAGSQKGQRTNSLYGGQSCTLSNSCSIRTASGVCVCIYTYICCLTPRRLWV